MWGCVLFDRRERAGWGGERSKDGHPQRRPPTRKTPPRPHPLPRPLPRPLRPRRLRKSNDRDANETENRSPGRRDPERKRRRKEAWAGNPLRHHGAPLPPKPPSHTGPGPDPVPLRPDTVLHLPLLPDRNLNPDSLFPFPFPILCVCGCATLEQGRRPSTGEGVRCSRGGGRGNESVFVW